jgi:hypothetical protein
VAAGATEGVGVIGVATMLLIVADVIGSAEPFGLAVGVAEPAGTTEADAPGTGVAEATGAGVAPFVSSRPRLLPVFPLRA